MKLFKWLMLIFSLFLLGCSGGTEKTYSEESLGAHVPLRVACVGDSITEGYKLSNPFVQSYPAQLAKLVADGVDVKNFGLRGRTIIKASEESYWNAEVYKQSLAYNPEVVVIMLGTNDMKNANYEKRFNIIDDYTALIGSYKVLHSKPTIYICLPTPSYGNIQGITNKRIVEVLIPMIKEVAIENSVRVIDMYTLLNDKKVLFPDTLHPNLEGARLMAEHVYQNIY